MEAWVRPIAPSSTLAEQVKRLEEKLLVNSYALKGEVHCGDPRFRLLPVGAVLTCSVTGSPKVSALHLSVASSGIFTANPPGLSSPAWMLGALSQHAAGKQTILDGPTVAAWIQLFLTAPAASDQQRNVQLRCPPSVDVTGTRHSTCIVSIQGHDLRREVFIDPVKGVDTRALDVPVDLATVQHEIQDDLNRRLQRGGLQADGVVRCNTGFLVVTPPLTFYCDAFGAANPYRVEVKVVDTTGTVNWRFISGKPTSSPVPTASPG